MEVDSNDVMISFDVPPQLSESSIEDETVRQYDNDDMQMAHNVRSNRRRVTERKEKIGGQRRLYIQNKGMKSQ
jgi:hypothetical protein